MHDNYN